MGGEEFCLLTTWCDDDSPETLMDLAVNALTERGDAVTIGASGGYTLLQPGEVSVAEAVRAADQRMYQAKTSGRRSAFVQTKDVLLEVLGVRRPELAAHTRKTAEVAERVARYLGLADDDVRHARHAAQLHDIGKLAVPGGVLSKRGTLTAEEHQWLERQTLAGERIVLAAPALAPIARLIRSSHERWDGNGFPDGVAGDAIPLI
jgi:two-component system cell cycle response regulator